MGADVRVLTSIAENAESIRRALRVVNESRIEDRWPRLWVYGLSWEGMEGHLGKIAAWAKGAAVSLAAHGTGDVERPDAGGSTNTRRVVLGGPEWWLVGECFSFCSDGEPQLWHKVRADNVAWLAEVVHTYARGAKGAAGDFAEWAKRTPRRHREMGAALRPAPSNRFLAMAKRHMALDRDANRLAAERVDLERTLANMRRPRNGVVEAGRAASSEEASIEARLAELTLKLKALQAEFATGRREGTKKRR